MANKYDDLSTDDFDRLLEEIIDVEGPVILAVPCVYELLAEHYNNEVLSAWEVEQEQKAAAEAEEEENGL